jgi:hypothetical protein
MRMDEDLPIGHPLRRGGLAAAVLLVTLLALSTTAAVPKPTASGSAENASMIRIGTYDSRAIAVAYARSAHMQAVHADLLRRRAEAQAHGDEPLVREIEAEGGALQLRLHLQGFSTAPVDDLLDAVRDRLPEIARRSGVGAITRSVDYHAATVEIVDVTDALVALFDPDSGVLSTVAELRSRAPLALEAVARPQRSH